MLAMSVRLADLLFLGVVLWSLWLSHSVLGSIKWYLLPAVPMGVLLLWYLLWSQAVRRGWEPKSWGASYFGMYLPGLVTLAVWFHFSLQTASNP